MESGRTSVHTATQFEWKNSNRVPCRSAALPCEKLRSSDGRAGKASATHASAASKMRRSSDGRRNEMKNQNLGSGLKKQLAAADLAVSNIQAWLAARPGKLTDFASDKRTFTKYWEKTGQLLGRPPQPPRRQQKKNTAARAILTAARENKTRVL